MGEIWELRPVSALVPAHSGRPSNMGTTDTSEEACHRRPDIIAIPSLPLHGDRGSHLPKLQEPHVEGAKVPE